MGKVIACVNQKGGVGKSTVIKNLAAGLAQRGKKVLAIDLDPSGNLTKMFGMESDEETGTILDVFDAVITSKEIPERYGILEQRSRYDDAEPEGFDIITSSGELNQYKTNIEKTMQRELLLDRYLKHVKGAYDYVLIDTPGGLEVLTDNALFAADSVIISTLAEKAALDSMQNVFGKISEVRAWRGADKLEVMGILFNMVQSNTNNDRIHMDGYIESAKDNVHFFNTYIPRLVKIKESDIPHKSIFRYAEKSQAALIYGEFVDEFLELNEGGAKK